MLKHNGDKPLTSNLAEYVFKFRITKWAKKIEILGFQALGLVLDTCVDLYPLFCSLPYKRKAAIHQASFKSVLYDNNLYFVIPLTLEHMNDIITGS